MRVIVQACQHVRQLPSAIGNLFFLSPLMPRLMPAYILAYHSALMALHDSCGLSTSSSTPGVTSDSTSSFNDEPGAVRTAAEVAEIMQVKLPEMASNIERMSPWGAFPAYEASIIYLRLSRYSHALGAVEALDALRMSLKTLNMRWKLAGQFPVRQLKKPWLTIIGAYLQILEAREVMNMP